MDKTILKNHLVNNPSDSFWDNLEGAWLFDDGSGTTITDYSSNGRDAALSKTGSADYTWDTTEGQEHLSLAYSATGNVLANLAGSLSVGDQAATMLLLMLDNTDAGIGDSISSYFRLGRCLMTTYYYNRTTNAKRLAHADTLTAGVDIDSTFGSYVVQHSGTNLEIFKNCVSEYTAEIDAVDDASDELFSHLMGGTAVIDIDIFGIILWSRILSQTEIGYICTALSGTNPWSSHSKFLIMF